MKGGTREVAEGRGPGGQPLRSRPLMLLQRVMGVWIVLASILLANYVGFLKTSYPWGPRDVVES